MQNISKELPKNKTNLREAAEDLLNEGKKFSNELYEESANKVHQVEDQIKEYSDELSLKVRENPLGSLLIAASIGFIISALRKK